MDTFTIGTTVGAIAAQSPASVRVFDKHGIDFCCGGNVAVGQACEARGLNAEEVLDELAHAAGLPPSSTDWQSAPLGALIDHVVGTHHAYLQTQLPRIEGMVEKVLAAHAERHGDVLRPLAAAFLGLKQELDAHLMKEEMILFPLVRRLEATSGAGGQTGSFHCGSVQNPIRVMLMEHDSAGGALARMRELTSGYTPPADACNTYRALYFELAELERDLHLHIHLENNILFPRAVELESR